MKIWTLCAVLSVAAAAPPPAYDAAQAEADVETIVTDTSKAYLQARGRLEANPAQAAAALRTRLDAVPPPGPSERGRLMNVLSEVAQPEDLPRFADALRRAVVNADPGASILEVAHPWRVLLLEQGSAATVHLQPLVGDEQLPLEVRAQLLSDWVDLQPAERTGELVVLVGRGQPALERELRRALADRARRDLQARSSVVTATDAALDAALGDAPDDQEAARLPALLRFRAGVGEDDGALVQRLEGVAADDGARFGARVAAIRGLGALPPQDTTEELHALAQGELDAAAAGSQRGEILAWLAMRSLPEADAARLAETFHLRDSDAPRLAALGYALAPRGSGHPWLAAATSNPWPQVRQAAYTRVASPCTDGTVDLLSTQGSASDQGGDTDRAAARAAVAALGRCRSPSARKSLRGILIDANGDIELRAEAARQLARLGETKPVVALLGRRPEAALARRLAAALRHAPGATVEMDAMLCAYAEQSGPVARAALESLRAHHDDDPC